MKQVRTFEESVQVNKEVLKKDRVDFCTRSFFVYSTVTDLARFRGLSTSNPRCKAAK